MDVKEKVSHLFVEKFSSQPAIYFSPGRINLIGEHVDYNDGFVMPAAINKGIYFAIAPNHSNIINFISIDLNDTLSIDIKDVKKMDGWKNYVLSVVNEFLLIGEVKGFDCVFGGDIPQGAGLSSSAAVEGGLALAINDMFHFGIDRVDLALLCQRAEHNFPDVNCGIMDQFANMMGKKDQVILLDCMTMTYKYFPLILEEYEIILINSKVHHSLATSEYNRRRMECDEGLMILGYDSNIRSFRDVSKVDNLYAYEGIMGEEVFMRCFFVVEEIERTQKAAKLLEQKNLVEFGKLMYKTHEGLSRLYYVSCKELDFLVDQAKNNGHVIGSRMMGGGFGGCTINLVEKEYSEKFIRETKEAYQKEFNIEAEHYEVEIVDGVRRL